MHTQICNNYDIKDHHCPWIGNCVGFFNQKSYIIFTISGFVLLLLLRSTAFNLWVSPSTNTSPLFRLQLTLWPRTKWASGSCSPWLALFSPYFSLDWPSTLFSSSPGTSLMSNLWKELSNILTVTESAPIPMILDSLPTLPLYTRENNGPFGSQPLMFLSMMALNTPCCPSSQNRIRKSYLKISKKN